MPHPLTALASVFPWDSQNESAMSHRHLMLGYAFAWTVQLAYLLSIGWKRRRVRKDAATHANSAHR